MKEKTTLLVLSVSIGGALAVLYAQFLLGFLRMVNLLPGTPLEYSILGAQVLKVIAIFSIRRLRRASYAVVLDLFSIEIFALPIMAVGNLVLGTGYYSSAAMTLFLIWLPSVALVVPSFLIYRSSMDIKEGGLLTSILPAVAFQAGTLIFAAQATGRASVAALGLKGFGESMVGAAGEQGGVGLVPNAIGLAALGLIYVSLAFYASGAGRSQSLIRWNFVIAMLAGATLLVSGLVYVAQSMMAGTLIVLVAPSIAMTVTLWWSTRET